MVQLLSDLTGLTRTPTISALITTIQVSMSESFLYYTIIILVRNLSLWIYFSYTYEHIHLIHITSTNKFLQFQSSILFFQTNHRQVCWHEDGHWRTRLHGWWRQVSWWCNWYTWWLSPHTCLILLHGGEFHSPSPWRLTSGRRQYLMIRMTTAFWRSRNRQLRTLLR